MIGYLRRLTIQNLISPYGLALFSYCVFLFGWNFPPSVYTDHLNEPDLLYHEPWTLLFYTSCVAGLMLGVKASTFLGARKPPQYLPPITARTPLTYLAIPLFVATILCAVFLVLLGGHINFVSLLASQQGGSVKSAMGGDSEGNWSASLMIMAATLWWAAFRAQQLRLKGLAKWVFYGFFSLAVVVDILTCVATVDRTSLMPVIAGLALIYLYGKTRQESVRLGRILFIGASSGVGILGTFLLLSFLRGASASKALVTSLMGYSIVSYNRMAALVTGVMHYAYQGRAVYLLPLLVRNDRINHITGLRDYFGWPDLLVQMESEFSAVLAAGLNPLYNWAGYFGYLYSDIGWWTWLYMFFFGILTGFLWSRFCAGKTDGIVMYMWIAFSILFWVGGNLVFGEKIVRIIAGAIFLVIYDKFSLRQPVVAPSPQITARPLRERTI